MSLKTRDPFLTRLQMIGSFNKKTKTSSFVVVAKLHGCREQHILVPSPGILLLVLTLMSIDLNGNLLCVHVINLSYDTIEWCCDLYILKCFTYTCEMFATINTGLVRELLYISQMCWAKYRSLKYSICNEARKYSLPATNGCAIACSL